MAILLDKEGLQNYANKMVLAENRKVGSKSLPSALADVDNLIEEMKGQFEAEYGSALDMKLENNENIFSVGTGSGVDKRSEVENSFTDIEIKGKTLQNLVNLDVSNNNFGTSGNGSGLSINRYKTGCEYKVVDETKTSHITVRFLQNKIVKPSTTYTLFFNVETNFPDTYKGITVCQISDSYFGNSNNRLAYSATFEYKNKRACISFTTLNSEVSLEHLGFGLPSIASHSLNPNDYFRIFDIMLLEGDYTNTPLSELPYVEGIQGVGEEVESGYEVGVKSCGKNLINPNEIVIGEFYRSGIIQRPESKHFCSLVRAKPNTSYTLNGGYNTMYIELGSTPTDYIKSENGGSTFTTTPDTNYLRIRPHKNPEQEGCVFHTLDDYISFIQLEESSTTTPYEPYVEDTLTYTLEEQLHRLPNGVCDEIKDGKLIRRVGKIVLDGSESWVATGYGGHPSRNTFEFNSITYSGSTLNSPKHCVSDKFSCYLTPGVPNNDWGFRAQYSTGRIYMLFSPDVGTIPYRDIDAWKQWLSENPTTVLYELVEPIITDLETPSLQCWKNGTISIDSTVPPTTIHTVALNKPAQIKRNIEELTTLRHKVKTLEEQYDQIALEQAHKLQLLNHSIELEGKR